MKYKILSIIVVFSLFMPVFVFSQQPVGLRDYVGIINQSYHPGIVSIFERTRDIFISRGETRAARAIDVFLSGGTGSGFLYSDARGNMYIITNNHVISHAHTISITFEQTDGTRRIFENLRLIATDVENDLAILAFSEGERAPVSAGLRFLTRQIQEGEEVFSAGFPGMGATPVWQFGHGRISNVAARFPGSFDDDVLIGPFVQHTAQIDRGNSGGPLLVAQPGVPSGYAVAGVNTGSGIGRQAANYAIPVSTTTGFIERALNQNPNTFRDELDRRLSDFVNGLNVNRVVFPHIADYLSNDCVGDNAEFAIERLFSGANTDARRAFIDKFEENIMEAMGYAVGWIIENSIRTGTTLRASIKEVTGEGEEYTVVFTFNNRDVNTIWIREFGNWRIRSFGTVATSDPDILNRRQAQREANEKLRVASIVNLELGYSKIINSEFEQSGALYFSADFFGLIGVNILYLDSDYMSFGVFTGTQMAFVTGNVGLTLFGRLGVDFISDSNYKQFEQAADHTMGFPFSGFIQGGMRITTTFVPGMFLGASYRISFLNAMGNEYTGPKMGNSFIITAGYSF